MAQNGKQWKFSVRQTGATRTRTAPGGQHPKSLRRRLLGNRLQLPGHPFACATETDIIRELTEDEAAFRSLTRSWFEHSDLYTILRLLSRKATGHHHLGPRNHPCDNPVKVTGDRETSANLRYKIGRNLRTTRARRSTPPGRHPAALEQPATRAHIRLQHRLPDLQQRRQPPYIRYTATRSNTAESRWK